jgi:hypothetical protein
MFMFLRNRLVVSIILAALAVTLGCGGSSGTTHPVPPPSGSFSNSNLNGTYVFSVSGTDDVTGVSYAIVGSFAANGQGGITGGSLDVNDGGTTPAPNIAVGSNSVYKVQVDGRGQATLNASTPIGNQIVLDFVLEDSAHGLITEFDNNGSGSGTLDLQTAGATPAGTYAFSMFGGASGGTALAVAGNFAVGNSNSITGLDDVNNGGSTLSSAAALSGTLVVGPSSTPSTTLASAGFSGTFDVYAVDATHLKFIEMDSTATLTGDAFSQTSTTMPVGNLAFTLAGCEPCGSTTFNPFVAGGFLVTDANGNVTSASTEDYNSGGTLSPATPNSFTANYAAGGTGRFTLSNFATTFFGGSTYAAYPSSGGLILLEIDNSGLTLGAAFAQSSTTLATSQGYGLNLSGTNLFGTGGTFGGGSPVEIDDIAEFTANSGGTLTGVIDENFAPGGGPNFSLALSSGTYAAPDSNGRGFLSAGAGNNSNSTLNGGFNLTFYSVDGTAFPFIEMDSGQIAAGVFVQQNPNASASAAARSHLFVTPTMFRPHGLVKKQK